MNLNKSFYRGYASHNKFGEYKIPVPAQNILYRDYAKKNNLNLKLSVSELFFEDCYLNLFNLLNELPNLKGLLLCSIFMLPKKVDTRKEIFKIILKHNSEIHFILENIIVKYEHDFNNLNNILNMKNHLRNDKYNDQILKLIGRTV